MALQDELPHGSLEMLILRILAQAPLHGYAIAQEIERLSEAYFRVEKGSLYPALDRILAQGWATAQWGDSPTGRRARVYHITASGRKQLKEKRQRHDRLQAAIRLVLGER